MKYLLVKNWPKEYIQSDSLYAGTILLSIFIGIICIIFTLPEVLEWTLVFVQWYGVYVQFCLSKLRKL